MERPWPPVQVYPRHSECYALRITFGNEEIPAHFWVGLTKLAEAVLAVEHDDTDKAHIHMAICNSRYTHDRLRKAIVKLVTETITDTPAKGNALMSLKKWDGADTYLVYMFKGNRYNTVHNFTEYEQTWLAPSRIQELREGWIEKMSKAAASWNDFKKSEFYPTLPTRTPEEWIASTDVAPPKIEFDTVRKNAILFAMAHLQVTVIDSKVRFIAKDLISNFCLFNNIKMLPLYI